MASVCNSIIIGHHNMHRRYRTLCLRFREVSVQGEGRKGRRGNVVSSHYVYLRHNGSRTAQSTRKVEMKVICRNDTDLAQTAYNRRIDTSDDRLDGRDDGK